MPKHILLLILKLLFLFQIIISETDVCTSNFEIKKAELCSQLSTSEKLCYFINDECKDWFKECSEYSPTSDFDENICQKITPSNNLKKCQVQTKEGTKSCIEVDKTCTDFSDNTCFDLILGSDKRCVLINGKCEEHYNSCEGLSKENCSNNIPSINSKRCIWNDSTSNCDSKDRQCQEFILYSEKGKNNLQCSSLKSTSPKICIMDGNICNEVYKTCEEAKDETTCKNTKPLQQYAEDAFSIFEKCIWEEGYCLKTDRTCSDYKKREDDSFDYCYYFKSEKTEHRDYKQCSLDTKTDTCKEIYKTCSSYNNVISKDERTETDCVAINPGQTSMNVNKGSKCFFDNEKKECKEIYKDCEDQTSVESCLLYQLENTKKYCFYDNDLCFEQYKYCENYNDEVEEADRKKEECESILPNYIDSYSYKCIFTESKTCEKKKLETCEEYEGNSKNFCNQIKIAESSTYRCAIKNNKCVTEYKDCYAYNNQINKTKEVCESILLSSSNKKCLFSTITTNTCYEDFKTCTDYAGTSDEECKNYRTSNASVVCVHENNKCIEKTNYIYKYCAEYGGKDKKICESIIPRSSWNNAILYGEKCVYNNYGCSSAKKVCSEAKNEKECYSITPEDSSRKHCVFINNECKEHYQTCIIYENSQTVLNKETCESIVIKNDNKNKCVFTEGKDGAKGTCRSVEKKCSDFHIESLAKECSDLTSSLAINSKKKCSFSDKTCKTVDKTSCAELYGIMDVTEEDCKTATTSSSNINCVFNSNYGCIQVNNYEMADNNDKDKDNNSNENKSSDKTKDDNSGSNSNDDNNNDNNNDNKRSDNTNDGGTSDISSSDNSNENKSKNNNYGKQNCLNKLLLILLSVLV